MIVQLLKEQNKYDQMPLNLLDWLQRILPLAEKVANEIVSEETEILEKLIPRMFEVMHKTTKFSCDYIKHGCFSRWSSFLDSAAADDHRENRRCTHLFEGKRND